MVALMELRIFLQKSNRLALSQQQMTGRNQCICKPRSWKARHQLLVKPHDKSHHNMQGPASSHHL
jgi:hypothetical protein